MSAMIRATLGRLRLRAPRRPSPAWRVGEPILIAACDRKTGRPERPAISFEAVVMNAGPLIVTVAVAEGGNRRAYDFYARSGWDAWPSDVTPWRLFHQAERWRL